MFLDVRCLSHTFPGKPPRAALDGIDLQVEAGELVAVIGSSGCGKSTLLRLVAGLLHPSGGQILVDGKPPLEFTRSQRIAWMAQKPALLPWLTAQANVALAQRYSPERERLMTPAEALAKVGLTDVMHVFPQALSGGMKQRVALARLLAVDARLWLMDEPLAAVDELTRERLVGEFAGLWQPLKPAVVWVTHNIYEALHLADRIVVFTPAPGKVAAEIPVPLARPRKESSPAFQSLLAEVRAILAGA